MVSRYEACASRRPRAVTNLLWVLALPLAALSWKIFSAYRRALKDRSSHRAQHLYFQSLGNNRSALFLITKMICEEENQRGNLVVRLLPSGGP